MDLISGLRAQAQGADVEVAADVSGALSLEGRTAVVTGAAMGIGRQTALTFDRAGAKVVIADVAEVGLEETASLMNGAILAPTDVSVRSAVDDLARRAIRAGGRIDVWANVAGVIRNAAVVDLSEEDLDAVLAVNLKGVTWGCAAAGRVMSAAGRGSIINVASAGGELPAPTLSAYGMAKAAVIQLTRVLAAELGPRGVRRANTVAPGFVETPMTSRNWTSPEGVVDEAHRREMLQRLSASSPLGTIGTTEDVAWSILYLASDISRFVTGQVLRVNGGVHMA